MCSHHTHTHTHTHTRTHTHTFKLRITYPFYEDQHIERNHIPSKNKHPIYESHTHTHTHTHTHIFYEEQDKDKNGTHRHTGTEFNEHAVKKNIWSCPHTG